MVVNSTGSLAKRKAKQKEQGVKEPELVTPRPPSILVSTGVPDERPFEELNDSPNVAQPQQQSTDGRTAEQFQQQQELVRNPAPIAKAEEIPKLDIKTPLSSVPLVGAVESIFQTASQSNTVKRIAGGKASDEETTLAMANFGLNDLDIAVLRNGEANVGGLRTAVDVLAKYLPRDFKKFAPGTVAAKAEAQQDLIKKLKINILQYKTNAVANPRAAGIYFEKVKAAEKELLRAESVNKLLTIQSPALQANPDEIDIAMAEIELAKLEVQSARDVFLQLGLR